MRGFFYCFLFVILERAKAGCYATACLLFLMFFLLVQKKTPENDYIPFSGSFSRFQRDKL